MGQQWPSGVFIPPIKIFRHIRPKNQLTSTCSSISLFFMAKKLTQLYSKLSSGDPVTIPSSFVSCVGISGIQRRIYWQNNHGELVIFCGKFL